jgi:hypothetical protein
MPPIQEIGAAKLSSRAGAMDNIAFAAVFLGIIIVVFVITFVWGAANESCVGL